MKKLELKDLITIGIFAAIYFAVYSATTMLAIIPVFMLLSPALASLVLGIPTMLLCAKVPKFGAFTLYGAIIGLLNILIGMGWWLLLCSFGLALVADLIMLTGKYKSFIRTLIGYALFGLWSLPILLPIWLSTEQYVGMMQGVYGAAWGEAVISFATGWGFFAAVAGIVACGAIGALIGRAILKKHFVKAGIV